jgi:hypothetical protein
MGKGKEREKMSYVSYRIATQHYNPHTYRLENGWFLLGQNSTDLNWRLIGVAPTKESAINRLISIRAHNLTLPDAPNRLVFIFDEHGYGIDNGVRK